MLPLHDIVCSLLEMPFSKRTEEVQRDIVRQGRPQSQITNTQKIKEHRNTKSYFRSFNHGNFEKFPWLCSSFYKQSLFCWPCLLLEKNLNQTTIWSTVGFSDWKHLCRAIEKHESSKDHLSHQYGLARMETTLNTIKEALVENGKSSKANFNEKVRLNRKVMKILIDTTIFLGKQELAFRGHDESTRSANKGNYKELLELLLRRASSDIRAHYQVISSVFSGGSKTIQNELIECIHEIIFEKIECDLNEAPFFSTQVDDTTDINHKPQNSIVVRFVDASGRIVERFLGFFDGSADKTASGLFNELDSRLKQFNYGKKLIGQTFDGASVMAGEVTGLQTRVKQVAPCALFTHSSAHRFNLVLLHGTEEIKECRTYFSHAISMAMYFHRSPMRSEVADKIIQRRFPQIDDTLWYSRSKIVHFVEKHHTDLSSIFSTIINDPLQTSESHSQAIGFLNIVSNFDFAFLTLIFKDIFDKAYDVYVVLQKKSLDIRYCLSRVNLFKEQLLHQRNVEEATQFYGRAVELVSSPTKVARRNVDDLDPITAKRSLYYAIIDNIMSQVNDRFCDLEKLVFLELADSSKFTTYQTEFPSAAIESLNMHYSSFFPDFSRLQNELEILYADELCQQKPIADLIKIMWSTGVHKILREAYRLMCLIASLSATSVSVEWSFSALRRILRYLRATMTEERSNNLSFFSIEKELLLELMDEDNFYDSVIRKFDEKRSRGIDLVFKQ